MSFSFRLRVNRSPSTTIQTDAASIDIPSPGSGVTLKFRSVDTNKDCSLRDAKQWALVGTGYGTEEAAMTNGERLQDALRLVFVKNGLGVDFGERSPTSALTQYGQTYYGEMLGKRVLNSAHGLMVYASEPTPVFMETSVQATAGKNYEKFQLDLLDAISRSPILQAEERVSASLFGASLFETRVDSRFILLVMAIEVLIRPKPKSATAIALVNEFLERVSASNIDDIEAASLRGSLNFLLQESISQAGKRIALEELKTKTYLSMSADKFFSRVYGMRSNLVHGNMPIPSYQDISGVVGETERFTSHLLTSLVESRKPMTT